MSFKIGVEKNKTDFLWLLICGLIILLPFVNIRLGVTGVNRYVVIIISLLILIWNNISISRYKQDRFWLIYTILLVIPALVHLDLNYIIFLFTDTLLPVYIGYAITIRDEKYMQKLILLLLRSGLILAVIGIFEAFTGINLIDRIFGLETIRFAANDYRMGIARAYASFSTSINFASYLNMMQILCLYVITVRRKKQYWIIYIILFIASILTVSRAPIAFNLLIQLYLLVKLGYLKKRHIPWLILLGCSFGIILAMRSGIVNIFVVSIGVILNSEKYVNQARLMGFGGAGQRIALFSWVFRDVKDHLLFGNGYNEVFAVKINRWGDMKTSIENYYLASFFCYGILAVTALVVLFTNLYCKCRPIKIFIVNTKDKNNITFYGFAVLVLSFLTLWTVSFKDEGRFFFIIMGIALANRKSAKRYLGIKNAYK